MKKGKFRGLSNEYKSIVIDRAFEKHQAPEILIKYREKREGKISEKEKMAIRMSPYGSFSRTFPFSVNKTKNGVETAAKRIRKNRNKPLIVNNIGFGYQAHGNEDSFGAGTYEPFFIADALEKMGKNYEVRAFALNPEEVEKAKKQKVLVKMKPQIEDMDSQTSFPDFEKHIKGEQLPAFGKCYEGKQELWVKIPKRILEKVKFNQLDLITETPAKQADITTLMGVPTVHEYLHRQTPKQMVMLKNAVDSTRKNGYVICEILESDEKAICRRLGLRKIDYNVYQKIR